MDDACLFLGITIVRDGAVRTVKLAQERTITDLVSKYKLGAARTTAVPLSPSIILSKTEGELLGADEQHS